MSAALFDWIQGLMPHLMLAPILLPMLTAAIMLLLREETRTAQMVLNMVSCAVGLAVSVMLLLWVIGSAGTDQGARQVYLASNWQAPFGIVLVLDRVSAMMLTLVAIVALASSVFASSRWHRAGVHFHPLFQLQIMGLCGAFLTGDLFNLFVFFEVMLAASYGLMLHGSGRLRVQAGMHYIAINLVASSLFLIGASMLYGLLGTLNMADMARSIQDLPASERSLLYSASAILGTAFLVKAAVWPLNFWLVPAYSTAAPPVGALFSLMTKVGIYVILRLWTLCFSMEANGSEHFGAEWLLVGGMVTMAFGGIGIMAATRLTHLASYAAILSSGTLLAAIGFSQNSLTAALLYYLPSSTLAVAILFMLADIMDRWRNDGNSYSDHNDEQAPFLSAKLESDHGVNLDDHEELLIGRAIPAAAAFLGVAYLLCTLVVTGLPPLSGFIGKFAMLSNIINPLGLGQSEDYAPAPLAWIFFALTIITGLLALISLTRAGVRYFWATHERSAPQIRIAEGVPIAALMLLCIALTISASGTIRYTQQAADDLHDPSRYINAVMNAPAQNNPSSLP